ncbi:MAG: hypothetical protein Q8S33_01345 [Myxococcales bacterium]|nr:hypothetical protein [Myxococcales bacterium]
MFARVLLLAIAALNLVPAIVAVSPRWSLTLYGFALDTPLLEVVMRHRAVLLGCVGVGLGVAAFRESWWGPAVAFALASKVSFLIFCALHATSLGPLRRVAVSDVVALLVLGAAAWLRR